MQAWLCGLVTDALAARDRRDGMGESLEAVPARQSAAEAVVKLALRAAEAIEETQSERERRKRRSDTAAADIKRLAALIHESDYIAEMLLEGRAEDALHTTKMLRQKALDGYKVMNEVHEQLRISKKAAAQDGEFPFSSHGWHGQADEAMHAYAAAASFTGAKPWLQAAFSWCVAVLEEHFCSTEEGRERHRAHAVREAARRSRVAFFHENNRQMSAQEIDEVVSQLNMSWTPPPWAHSFANGCTSIRVLDVGSCHNPLRRWSGIDVLAFDLQPATADVLRADFLELRFDGLEVDGEQLLSLPQQSFQAVMLSMVLSFLPSPAMRMEMVQRAQRCLVDDGILLVIETPIILRGGALYSDVQDGGEGIDGFTATFTSVGLQLLGGRWKRGERPCRPLLGAFRKYGVLSGADSGVLA